MNTSFNHQNFYDITYRSNIFNLDNSEIFSDRREYSPIIRKTLSLIEKSKYKNITNYDPSFYYNNSKFSKERLYHKKQKIQNLPHKKKVPYSIQLINYRKYGSSFNCNDESLILKHKPKCLSTQNSANASFDNGNNPKELKIIMNQSNIFNDNEKEQINKNNLKNSILNFYKKKDKINKDYIIIKRESKSLNSQLNKGKENIIPKQHTKNIISFKNLGMYQNILLKKKPNNYFEIEFNDSMDKRNNLKNDINQNKTLSNNNKMIQMNKLIKKIQL